MGKRAKSGGTPGPIETIMAEARRRDHELLYRRMWRGAIDEMAAGADDDRYRFMRSMIAASELGIARSTVIHAINPGLASYLDHLPRAHVGTTVPPVVYVNDSNAVQLLGSSVVNQDTGRVRAAEAFNAARLVLARDARGHSIVFELTAIKGISGNSVARAFSAPGVRGWSQSEVSRTKHEAVSYVREVCQRAKLSTHAS